MYRAEGLSNRIGRFHAEGEARVKPCLVVHRVLRASDLWLSQQRCIPRHGSDAAAEPVLGGSQLRGFELRSFVGTRSS